MSNESKIEKLPLIDYNNRIINVYDDIEDETCMKIIGYLDCIKRVEVMDGNLHDYTPLYFYISSGGGVARDSITLHYSMKYMHTEVKTIITGRASSAASILFCGGSGRIVYPQSSFMVHSSGVSGHFNDDEFKTHHSLIKKINDAMIKIYVNNSLEEYDENFWRTQIEKDNYFVGKEIYDLGIANMYINDEQLFIRHDNGEEDIKHIVNDQELPII